MTALPTPHQRQTAAWADHQAAVIARNAVRNAVRQQRRTAASEQHRAAAPEPLPPAPAAPRRNQRVGDCRQRCNQGNPCCCQANYDHHWHICSDPHCHCHEL